ncbi:MAG TPA: isocitrate/isopropylmalate family dehydrogenase [Pirellulales bacterium]|nr:isocitrate/isopropylmalate family dehydrogenase [Pirellulales bacterium]
MRNYRIALYPGDGVGPEVIAEAVRVLAAVEKRQDAFHLELTELPWGYGFYRQTGRVAPDDFLHVLRPFDAILLGAVGWPAELPDHVTLDPLVRIRQSFDQYACVRPARLLPGVPCVLTNKGPRDVDLVVIRENSEGEYVNIGGRFHVGHPDESAVQTAVHTRRGVERILRFGFRMALTRRQRLTMITKSNAQRFAYVLWDELLEQLRGEYPAVEVDKQHADAAVMNFVRCPERFDVVVASNLFGDILTDLGGLISGGLGLAPSSNLCPEGTAPSMFEPVHGSAPDIAGKGIANPIAAVLSAAMMLDWLGQAWAAGAVRGAVERVLAAGEATPDLGGRLSTSQLGQRLVEAITSCD